MFFRDLFSTQIGKFLGSNFETVFKKLTIIEASIYELLDL